MFVCKNKTHLKVLTWEDVSGSCRRRRGYGCPPEHTHVFALTGRGSKRNFVFVADVHKILVKAQYYAKPVKLYRTPPFSNSISSATQKCCGVEFGLLWISFLNLEYVFYSIKNSISFFCQFRSMCFLICLFFLNFFNPLGYEFRVNKYLAHSVFFDKWI